MKLSITLDYELFGDGSGDVFRHIIEPTEKILKICDANKIKTTIFFEVVEYWKIKKEWENGNKMGYNQNPIEAINTQLKTAHLNGHDIQLHFHPQWVGANYNDGKWHVDLGNWALGSYKTVENMDMDSLIKKGKETLEEIIHEIDLSYLAIMIRAGGYNILPSKVVGEAMIKNGLTIDSSIYPGGYENGALSNYDYTMINHEMEYWYSSVNDFRKPQKDSKAKILEIPIFALNIPRWKKITIERLKSALINKESAQNKLKAKTLNLTLPEKIKYWLEYEAITWDFCLFSPRLHKYYFSFIKSNLLNTREYFVTIGHPKNFNSSKSINEFIRLAKINNVKFITLSEYAKGIIS